MANRLDLVYGRSRAGKSTWVIDLATHLYTQKGLKTRIYLGDGGYETYASSGLIEEGVLEVWQYNNRDNPFATLQFGCEGYWPQNVEDPKSKLVAPDPLILTNLYGLVVYEGLSVAADYMMGDKVGGLSNRAAKGEKIGQDSPFVVTEDGLKFGGNPPSHFGFVQRRIVDLIERTRALPVPFVLWTAHERKSEDYETRETEFGPDIAGKALTTKIGAYFGNTIHLHKAHKKGKRRDPVTQKEIDTTEEQFRAYTRTHFDPDGQTAVKYYANNRMPKVFSGDMPEYIEGADPIKFYTILENGKVKMQQLLRDQRLAKAGELQTP